MIVNSQSPILTTMKICLILCLREETEVIDFGAHTPMWSPHVLTKLHEPPLEIRNTWVVCIALYQDLQSGTIFRNPGGLELVFDANLRFETTLIGGLKFVAFVIPPCTV